MTESWQGPPCVRPGTSRRGSLGADVPVEWGCGSGLFRALGSYFSLPWSLNSFVRQNVFNYHLMSNYYVPGAFAHTIH